MGGGGEDFGAQQAQAEAKKQSARDALNLQFGVMPSTSAPTRAQFTTPGGYYGAPAQGTDGTDGGGYVGPTLTPDTFDQTGYDAALAQFNALQPEADKNKAAREALYSGVRDNAFTAGTRRLDDANQKATRDEKFALFGQGLNGGSVDVDENALLNRTYNQGKLDVGAKADSASADLRGNDEQTRLGLLQAIDSGLDQGSALSSSLNQLKANSDRAAAEGAGTDLGDLFGTAGLLYTKSEAGRGKTDAQSYWNTNYPTAARRGPSTGIVSSTGGP